MRYRSIKTLGKAALGLSAALGFSLNLIGADAKGFVKREVYLNPGAGTPTSVPPFVGNPKYPDSPDSVTYLDEWVSPQTADPNVENYGGRLSGYITPAETADYVFFVASDDAGAFYLSTDASPGNLKLIAQESVWANTRQWQTSGGSSPLAGKRSDQFTGTQWPTGAKISLVKGQKYYAEMLWKEGGGGDNGGVTMIKASDVVTTPDDPTGGVPAENDVSTLKGDQISVEAPTALGFLKQPLSQTVEQSRQVTFSVTAVTPPGDPVQDATKLVPDVTYQWRRNGADIPPVDADGDGTPDVGSSDTATYIIPAALVADNGAKFTCKITTGGGLTATSTEAVLTVSSDVTKPTIAKATGSAFFNSVTVTFSEDVDASTATVSLSGGLVVGPITVPGPSTLFIETSAQTQGTAYTVTVNNIKDLTGNAMTANTATFYGYVFKSGSVTYSTWQGQTVPFADFTEGTPPVNTLPPTTTGLKTLFEANTADEFDNYFGQLVGWFTPPVSGDYVFYWSSDDHGELYLSTDDSPANKKKIAEEPGWSNRRVWLSDGTSDNTASRGEEGSWANRSDQSPGTLWSTGVGGKITLDATKKYYIEGLFKEGGGGDNGGATFKLVSETDPANGTPSAFTGAVIGTFIEPPPPGPPTITTRPVSVSFNAGENISFAVSADSVTPMTYQWYHNKKAIAGATSATLTIPKAGVLDVGDYYVDVSNDKGTTSSFPDDSSRAVLKGVAYVIEAEDYNYDNGKTVAAASTMPLVADLYKGKDGIPEVDFHNGSPSGGAAEANGNSLRNGWLDGTTTTNQPPAGAGGNLDVIIDNGGGNTERPDFTIANNYKIGWGGTGNWYQYTRDFAPGQYNAVWVGSRDLRDPDAYGRTLEIVTGDITKADAATTVVGELTFSGTGAWSSNDSIPFLTPGGSDLANITLGANTTVRLRISKGDGDNDYLLFYKTSAVPAPVITGTVLNANGSITITWTGGGQLEAAGSLNGTYAPVPGATGGTFTWTPTAADSLLFARVRN